MIQLRNIQLSFGERAIFEEISCVLGAQQRVGLIGRNGAGKSTLLKIIAGQQSADSGSVCVERGKKVAYLAQEVVLESKLSAFDEAFTVFNFYLELEKEFKQLEEQLTQGFDQAGRHGDLSGEAPAGAKTDPEAVLERYVEVQEQLSRFDKSQARARTEKILDGLGFNATLKNQAVHELSVGWRMRLVLAKLLLEDADFYLFDEPTNHLDITTKQWFFEFLKQADFGYLLVTHDRYFLDNACDYMFELERGKHTVFRGNFSQFVFQKEQQAQVTESAFNRQQKEIAHKEQLINKFRASATKAKFAQSLIKQLDKIERIEVEPELPTIKLTFPPSTRAGSIVLTLKAVQHSFEQKLLFQNLNCEVERGEKVALIAPNGTGKTTLFNILTGKYSLQKGQVHFGHNVQHTIFEQDQMRVLKPKNTVLQEVLDACPQITEATIRGFLGSFLFSGDDVYKKIEQLSGGERNRVAMVKVLLQKANFLLLDEPTNHLDLYAKEILLQALQQYDGTLLLVSHDHDFLNKLSTRIIELTPTGLHSYDGNYESYLEQKKYQESKQPKIEPAGSSTGPVTNGAKDEKPQKELFELRKELAALETKIARLEKEIEEINKLFICCQYGSEKYNNVVAKLQAAQKSHVEAFKKWEELAAIVG